MTWESEQNWELRWWGACTHTFHEELKQWLYAMRMGIDKRVNYNVEVLDLHGASVIDIGGGPVSMLLKSLNKQQCLDGELHKNNPVDRSECLVIDPAKYPKWVIDRYNAAEIGYLRLPGEKITTKIGYFDECWIYNVLQHVKDPRLIIENAKKVSGKIRIFEWIDTKKTDGHPNVLTKSLLDEWLDGSGETELLNGQYNCRGKAYYGVF